MRPLRLLCLAACALLLGPALLAATRPQPGKPRPARVSPGRSRATNPRRLAHLVGENNDFAFRLYQRLRGEPGNLVFSPYSISTALAMTYSGAGGETRRQMGRVLGFYSLGPELDPTFADLHARLTSPARPTGAGEPSFQLHVANALWGQQGHPFLRRYTEAVRMYYGGGLETVDFRGNPERARGTINQWVGEQTAGKIPDLLAARVLTPDTRLVLTNAIYFKAPWQDPFPAENTRPGPFTLLSGARVTTDMMRETLTTGYVKGEGYEAIELPYRGRALSMLVLLPAAGQFPAFEAALTGARLRGLTALRPARVDLTMPKFRYDSQFSLAGTLAKMGMADAFSTRADFSGMDGQHFLLIQAVIHKALIRADEQGTEAAAATAVVMRLKGAPAGSPITLTLDRPFLYLIRDNQTGSLLFLGRVVDPRG